MRDTIEGGNRRDESHWDISAGCRHIDVHLEVRSLDERRRPFWKLGVPIFGRIVKRIQGVRKENTALRERRVCLHGFVSASANFFVPSVYMLTELTARSAFHIASNVYIKTH